MVREETGNFLKKMDKIQIILGTRILAV